MIASRSARPALLGAVLITVGGLGWYYFLPASAEAALVAAAVLNVLMVLIFALTVVVFFLLYLGPYRNPGWLSPGFAGSLCLFGIAAFSTGEFIREAVRKPFVVYNVVLGNQILPAGGAEVPRAATWRAACGPRPTWPSTIRRRSSTGGSMAAELLTLPPKDRIALGEVLFQYHCNDCHAATDGYSAVGPLLQGRSREMILATIEHLDAVSSCRPGAARPRRPNC